MARPRKPVKLLLLGGAGKRNPARLRGRATKGADGTWEEGVCPEPGLGDPPDFFDESQRARWDDLKKFVVPGILTRMDRPSAEVLCQLWASARRNELSSTDRKLLISLFGKFGLTPSERSKVGIQGAPRKKQANPFQMLDGA